MRIITLTQPWATLVAIGAKRLETRSWDTSYRGTLGIHAAKGFPKWATDLVATEPFQSTLRMGGRFPIHWHDLPTGCVVAITTLEGTEPTDSMFLAEDAISPEERAFGDYSSGRFAWHLGPVHMVNPVIPATGALGLWIPDAGLARQLDAVMGVPA